MPPPPPPMDAETLLLPPADSGVFLPADFPLLFGVFGGGGRIFFLAATASRRFAFSTPFSTAPINRRFSNNAREGGGPPPLCSRFAADGAADKARLAPPPADAPAFRCSGVTEPPRIPPATRTAGAREAPRPRVRPGVRSEPCGRGRARIVRRPPPNPPPTRRLAPQTHRAAGGAGRWRRTAGTDRRRPRDNGRETTSDETDTSRVRGRPA